MKAILLAAGLGTRLRPITRDKPKCLVTIGGRPLLEYWLNAFRKHGFRDILINVHHLAEQVVDFLAAQDSALNITIFHEPELLGSAGTVLANKQWLAGEEKFLIAYADNLTNVNLRSMIDFHARQRPVATIGLFETDKPEECGVVEMDANGTILSFVEKSANPPSRLANAGVYVGTPALLDWIPDKRPADFGFDVFPKMSGLLKGYVIHDYFQDVGDPDRYWRAQQDVETIKF